VSTYLEGLGLGQTCLRRTSGKTDRDPRCFRLGLAFRRRQLTENGLRELRWLRTWEQQIYPILDCATPAALLVVLLLSFFSELFFRWCHNAVSQHCPCLNTDSEIKSIYERMRSIISLLVPAFVASHAASAARLQARAAATGSIPDYVNTYGTSSLSFLISIEHLN